MSDDHHSLHSVADIMDAETMAQLTAAAAEAQTSDSKLVEELQKHQSQMEAAAAHYRNQHHPQIGAKLQQHKRQNQSLQKPQVQQLQSQQLQQQQHQPHQVHSQQQQSQQAQQTQQQHQHHLSNSHNFLDPIDEHSAKHRNERGSSGFQLNQQMGLSELNHNNHNNMTNLNSELNQALIGNGLSNMNNGISNGMNTNLNNLNNGLNNLSPNAADLLNYHGLQGLDEAAARVIFPELNRAQQTKPASKPRPKKYHCTVEGCPKAYSRPCLLEQHLRSHTDERPFVCSFPNCNKAFLRDSHLKTHLLSHAEKKPLTCPICKRGFTTNQHLSRHVRTHYPSLACPFDECSELFRRNSQVQKHIAEVHQNDVVDVTVARGGVRKKFTCEHKDCGKIFVSKSTYDSHLLRAHAAYPRYSCARPGCNESHLTWGDLQAHVKMVHGGDALKGEDPSQEQVPKKLQESVSNMVMDNVNGVNRLENGNGEKNSVLSHTPDETDAAVASALQAENGNSTLVSQSLTGDLDDGSMLDRITEGDFADLDKPIVCTFDGCLYRFVREMDLQAHLESVHGMSNGNPQSQPVQKRESNKMGLESFSIIDPEILKNNR